VDINKRYGISFDVYPMDNKLYRLAVVETKDVNGSVWSYDKILPYSKEIITEHFHLNIVKTKEPQDAKYRFVIKDLQDAIIKQKAMRQSYTNIYPTVRQLNETIVKQKNIIISTMKSLSQSITVKQALLKESIKEQ